MMRVMDFEKRVKKESSKVKLEWHEIKAKVN